MVGRDRSKAHHRAGRILRSNVVMGMGRFRKYGNSLDSLVGNQKETTDFEGFPIEEYIAILVLVVIV